MEYTPPPPEKRNKKKVIGITNCANRSPGLVFRSLDLYNSCSWIAICSLDLHLSTLSSDGLQFFPSLPRLRQFVFSDCNSFPRFRQFVFSDCNSFPRFTQFVFSDCNSFPRFTQFVFSGCNSFPRFTQFVPLDLLVPPIYTARSLGFHCVNRGNEFNLRKRVVIIERTHFNLKERAV